MGTITPISVAERQAARRASLPDTLSSSVMRKQMVERMRFGLTQLVEGNAERVQAWIDTIAVVDGPKAALEMYLKLLEFAVPKLTRAEVSVEDGDKTKKAELSIPELQDIIRNAQAIEGTATHVATKPVDDYSDLIS